MHNVERGGREPLSISQRLINKYSKKFGLTYYQSKMAKRIAENPEVQEASTAYCLYMGKFRKKSRITKTFEELGFKILYAFRDKIAGIHPVIKNQPGVYRAALTAIEHTINKVED